jgi:Uma2 family endonuclease
MSAMVTRHALPSSPDGASAYHGLRMTEEEFLELPEEKPYLEYVDGVVLQKPTANAAHRRIVFNLNGAFFVYMQDRGGDAGPEGRVRLGDLPNYRVPDMSYWVPDIPSGNDSLPTLGVEVRSPGQTMDELRAKCRFYRRSGIAVAWLLDPRSRAVEIYEDEREGDLLAPGEKLRSPHVPGFAITQEDLFAGVQ